MGDRLEWLRELREAQVTRGAKHGSTPTKLVTSVTKPRNTAVTEPVTVTPPVTPCMRCLELETEVKHLKRQLAKAGLGEPMTAAERMRRMREKRRTPRAD